MAPSQAPRGSSGYFTIHGQYLSYAAGINVPGTGVSMYVSANLSDSQIETSYSVAPDAGVGAHTVIDTTTSGTSNGLTFTVPAPPTGCGDPQKDAPIAEHENPQYQQTWAPACGDLANSAGSAHFSFSELNSGHYSWAIIRDYFLSGTECVRAAGENQPMTVNSGYRNPAKQMQVNPGSPDSRHTRGDAADVAETNPTRRLKFKQTWGPGCGACVEPLDDTPTWVHFDWRGKCPWP